MKIPDNPLFFQDQGEWRAWLSKNHTSEKEAWLVLNKSRVPGPGMNLPQAVEEALCFGWIDSILQRKDDNTYVLRFTPRKPRSIWSVSNQKRVEKLIAQGRMTEVGMAEVRRAHENGEWEAAIRRDTITALPEALAAAFSEHPDAREKFEALAPTYKKQFINWIGAARTPATLARRVDESVEMLKHGLRLIDRPPEK